MVLYVLAQVSSYSSYLSIDARLQSNDGPANDIHVATLHAQLSSLPGSRRSGDEGRHSLIRVYHMLVEYTLYKPPVQLSSMSRRQLAPPSCDPSAQLALPLPSHFAVGYLA